MTTKEEEIDLKELDDKRRDAKVQDFKELLKKISDVDDKKKQLWLEIYENAITDRQNAFVMFAKLSRLTEDKSTEHAVHGKTMATYIERMSRANDQLIKLAELISRSDPENEPIDPDEVFGRIQKG